MWVNLGLPSALCLSIHPSMAFCLSRVRSQWQQAQWAIPDFLFPSNAFQLLLRDSEAVPGQMRYIIPPTGSGSALGSPPSWTCLQREAHWSCVRGLSFWQKKSWQCTEMKRCEYKSTLNIGLKWPKLGRWRNATLTEHFLPFPQQAYTT